MRCTSCSRPIKPVVAIDIDGTLGDYHRHLLSFAQEYLDQAPIGAPYQGQARFGEWFCKAFSVDMTTFRQIKLAYRQGGMKRTMPVYNGATALVQKVRERAEVWLTTTRPYLRLDNVDPDTRFWLARHDIVYDGMLYDEDKYERLAELVQRERVVAVLDDLIEQIHAANVVFGSGVAIHRMSQYNVHAGWNHHNATDLYEAQMQILQRIGSWERRVKD